MVQKVCAEGKILNPETNRCINDTPVNRKKVDKIKKNIKHNSLIKISPRLSPKLSSKLSPRASTNVIQSDISPMGPVIHPEYIYDINDTLNVYTKFDIIGNNNLELYNYIYTEKFQNIMQNKDSVILSEMEMNDLLKLGNIVKDYLFKKKFITNEKYTIATKIEKRIKSIMKKETTTLIHDLPKNKHVGTNEITSSRYQVRELVLGLFNRINLDLYTMNCVLKDKVFGDEVINYTHIQSVYRDKECINEIIKLGIFSYDDLWNNVFKDPQIYEKLLETYAKYLELYNKLEKEKQVGGKKKPKRKTKKVLKRFIDELKKST